MPKQIRFNQAAREKLLVGARLLAKTVAVTYGPMGRTVMLDRVAGLLATKDGVTVAREIHLSDPVENMGAQILKDACIKVNDEVGDGTTTAAIVAAAVLEEAHKLVTAGYDPMALSRGILAAVKVAEQVVQDLAMPVESQAELESVALVASNDDEEVAKALAEACMAVGKDGTVSIEDGHGMGIVLVYKDGMEIDRGAVSPAFLREGGGVERIMEKPLVAVFGGPLHAIEDIQHALEESSQWPDNDLLVFAETIDGAALTTMLLNEAKGIVKSCAVAAPGFGDKKKEYLKDIAALSGATYIDPAAGMDFHKGFPSEWFGSLQQAKVKAKMTTILAYQEAKESVQERMNVLRQEMARCTSDYDRDRISERLAKLAGGMCVMQVGGPTEAALKERRARVEDALGAVRAALEGGIVAGAGATYLAISEALLDEPALDDHDRGRQILGHALRLPAQILAANAGHEGTAIVHQVLEARKQQSDRSSDWLGWDVRQACIRDLGDTDTGDLIIDPVPVILSVIRAATSVASTLLTAEVSVSEKP